MKIPNLNYSIISFVLFLAATLWFVSGKSQNMDLAIYEFVCDNIRNENLTEIMLFLTKLASTKYVLVLIVVLILVPIDSKRYGFDIGLSTLCQISINIILKSMFKRERITENILVHELSYSFPSSHTVTAVVVYGFVTYICGRLVNKIYIKILVYMVGIAVIGLISFSRIYLGAHYFSDVIAGIFLSLAFLNFAIVASNSIRKNSIWF